MSTIKKIACGIVLAVVSMTCHPSMIGQVELLERSNAMTAKVIRFAKQQSAKVGEKQLGSKARTQLILDIENLLAAEKNPAVLARVALMTRLLVFSRQDNGDDFDEIIGEVLNEAWFGCIKNIKQTGDKKALAALDGMRSTLEIPLDGASSLALRKAREEIEEQLKKKSPAR